MAGLAPALIPDPTADLHWDDFKGPITSFLVKHATENPGRIFVTETGSEQEKARTFTYQQINEASNIVAHHLIDSGIQRDEVCMIYAHRGVDLVISIIGVLKAGATFSVIDIAYPPDRQNVYLDVARPRALVVIEKATELTGGLHSKVTTWIAENLDLRTTVPALKLLDDGTLIGGSLSADDEDVFKGANAKKASAPDVIIGPDHIPTLSFTSGSEGKPKGVKGRHFSLTHYVPWMQQQFGISRDDRFTMLSGIAHDPIQRDIFTPIFLGAQLFVPHSDDIQHVRLAEWMREHSCTVTHLTPAMGQILVGAATSQFPALKNTFLVGDVLLKRDVRRLQELAPNTTVINMFGTTETQRAVSYFAIPSRTKEPGFLEQLGDKVPAGKGMNNVQLLVVDRANPQRICNIGEEGEIYVRAAGLAEGYLGLDEFTKQKFIPTWFVDQSHWQDQYKERQAKASSHEPWRQYFKGPRDRLYRSGDLGVYMESGDVRVVGRADDQVKIRGFRIELGEIDTHLSQHPAVRENVTLVRKSPDGDGTLVSYVVPEMSIWSSWLSEKQLSEESSDPSATSMSNNLRRFRPLLDDVKRHIGEKMPDYAVPSVIVPLLKMPLNPNGKVDRPNLPFPTADEQRAAFPSKPNVNISTLSDTERRTSGVLSRVLEVPVESIHLDDNIFDLGVHSLSAQRILLGVKQEFGKMKLSLQAIYSHPTLGSFSKAIDEARASSAPATDTSSTPAYAIDYGLQAKSLPTTFESAKRDLGSPLTIFMTGATGFLGSFILQDILSRSQVQRSIKVVVHVRAPGGEAEGMQRIVKSCKAYGTWSDHWMAHLECVTGDLEQPQLGLKPETWKRLSDSVDIIIHNGARVHWVDSYEKLQAANVSSTLAVLSLASSGRAKEVTFVSSTSALDSEHYNRMSKGGQPVPENDDMQGSASGLGTGYGQTKWVSEQLMMEAGRRGLVGTIIRPGYVTGELKNGSSITDDFLVRMLKGCVQLSARPKLPTNINAVPVNQVARITVASALHPPSSGVRVCQITGRPRLTWSEYLGCLEAFGYATPEVEYRQWADALEKHVADGKPHELEPLLIFATSDLPGETYAPEMDDANSQNALKLDKDNSLQEGYATGLDEDIVGRYIAYLVAIGWMPSPATGGAKSLPAVDVTEEQKAALKQLGGRGGGAVAVVV